LSKFVVGVLQASYSIHPLENAEKSYRLVRKNYREADLVVLPEYSMLNPLELKDPLRVYEASEYLATSKYLVQFVKLVREIGSNILVHFIERTDKPPLTRSTSVLVTSRGEVLPVYSKMHLFDAYGYRESSFFEPGREPGKIVSFNGVQVGFAICYDLRFPELFRTLALSGAHVVVVQAGWVKGPLKEEVLNKVASTRAHENGVYIVLANQTGGLFAGRSGVFNPWGYREVDMGVEEKYVEYSINLDDLYRVRETLPVLKQASERWDIKLKA
jgi:predicted amidohydrolase